MRSPGKVTMKLNLAFLFLFFIGVAFGEGAQRQFLHSPEDFYIHTRNHVNNVQRLTREALELIKSDIKKWGPIFGIPEGTKIDSKLEKLVIDFMNVHDDAKLITNEEFLKKHNLEKPLVKSLYEKVGQTVTQVYAAQATDPTIVNLNRVDSSIGDEVFKANDIDESDWRRQFVLKLEKKVDPVERSENPVTPEEMGRAAYKESGRPLYKIQNDKTLTPGQIKNLEVESEFAKELENRYSKVAVHFNDERQRYQVMKEALKKAGVYKLPLDQFAEFELISEFEKKYGPIKNVNDPELSQKFKKFFFNTAEGEKILLGRVPSEKRGNIAAIFQQVKKPQQVLKVLDLIDCQNEFSLIP